MPVSHHEGKAWLEAHYSIIRPARVVDVGAGEGIYSMRMRPIHRAYWTAVEAWEPYVERFALTSKYDEILVGDIRDIELPPADLYIAGDVLEHMSREDALLVIRRMQAAAPHVFVSVPIIEIHQGAVGGNPYEAHEHHWTFAEMHEALGYCLAAEGEVIGAFHWTRGDD